MIKHLSLPSYSPRLTSSSPATHNRAVPYWVCNQTGYYCDENIDYHLSWLRCTQEYDIGPIDYIGNWNERPWGPPDWTKDFRQALDDGGFADTQIIIPDGNSPADYLKDMDTDPALRSAVAGVGLHYPCNRPDPAVVDSYGLKFWASEDYSTVGDWAGAGCWGRLLNQNFVRMNMTATISWGLLWSVYNVGFPYYGNGLMYAYEPWSGYYTVNTPIWTSAQTCQFVQPGWTMLHARPGRGASALPHGGSYVTFVDPSKDNVTIVVEKLEGDCLRCAGGATQAETVTFTLAGGLEKHRRLQLWSTNSTHQFVQHPDVTVGADNTVRLAVERDTVYTLSSWFNGQSKGSATIPPQGAFPKPYADNFDRYRVDDLARFMADDGGSFQTALSPDGNTSRGGVLKQWVRNENGVNRWGHNTDPITYLGSPNWTATALSVDVRLTSTGPAPEPVPPPQSGDWVFFVSEANGNCLDVAGQSKAAGARIDTYTCVQQDNERFRYDAATGHIVANEVCGRDAVEGMACNGWRVGMVCKG